MDELKTMTTDQAIGILQKAIKQGGTFGFVEEFQTAANMAIKSLTRCAAPENKPLTTRQLTKMVGNPIWLVMIGSAKLPRCENVVGNYKIGIKRGINMRSAIYPNEFGDFAWYGKTWLVYAQKPEQGKIDGQIRDGART